MSRMGRSSSSSDVTVREATDDDREAIITLCRSTLGWTDGAVDEAFFAWKHDKNHFGPSPSWVAVADDEIVGVRVFMRWRFRQFDGTTFEAVRAVDTATSPEWQGKGIFNRLTLGALPDLRRSGTDFVFNTPNDKSRPGYLKMGWSQVGRVPVSVRPTSPRSLQRLLGARTAADRWSQPVDIGLDPADAFADDDVIDGLLASLPSSPGLATDRSVGYLRWRYQFDPLQYRVVPVGDRIADGFAVVRARRRGTALEATVCELLVPSGRSTASLWSALASGTGADFMIRAGRGGVSDRFVPAPSIGPVLTWKPLCRAGVPSMGDLTLSLGDVELF